ncbi:MAG: hypothetical protein QOE86_1924 [Solirubrobacteraceae bacterium]|jgi:hypothetical protein|nr:hypothetical protein [Solirubrobacteraceae bacterium]
MKDVLLDIFGPLIVLGAGALYGAMAWLGYRR